MRETDIERVLKAAGMRERPTAAVEHAVRESLRREWRAVVAEERGRRNRRTALALAASVAVAMIGAWMVAPRPGGPAEAVATVALATGELRAHSGWLAGWSEVGAGAALETGQTLATGAEGRAALALPGGISVRLDRSSRIRLAAADRLVVERGALYVDSGRDAAAASALDVVTPEGTITHVGTQYDVRLLGATVRVRIREGRIEWRSDSGSVANGRAGEQLEIVDARVNRSQVSRHGESWEWVASTTPVIDVNGLPLAEFLHWAGRELGCEIVFETPALEAEASRILVQGSIQGLTPAQAVQAVFATTKLRAVVADGRISVTRPPGEL